MGFVAVMNRQSGSRLTEDRILDHASPLIHCKQQRERFEVLTLLDVVFEKYRHGEDTF